MAHIYWLHLPSETDFFTQGYIGACSDINARLRSHKHRFKTIWDKVIVTKLIEATLNYCFEIEAKLRPNRKIGWNVAAGGKCNSMHGIDNPNFGKFGEESPHFIGWYLTPLGRFSSLQTASKAHNCNISTISRNCLGRKTKIKFYEPKFGFAFQQKVVG